MVATLEVLLHLRDDFSAQLRQHKRELTSFGRDLSLIGAAGVAGFGLAVKSAIDFESSFAGVRKTVDASEAEFADLQETFRGMARQMPVNVNEINRIAEAAGQLGIKVSDIEGFTRVMAQMGATTNLSSDEAATAMARLANITQMPQSEFGRLGATVVDLGNKFAASESEIVDMGLRIAGAGHIIGLTEAQTLSFATALSSVGIEAEAGGTAISRVFVDIAKAVDTGGDKLEGFAEVAGMSAEEFSQAFQRDAAGAIVTFIEGLGRIKDEGGSTFQVLEDLGQGNVRVRQALLNAAGAGDKLRESLEVGSAAWQENTALTTEYEKRAATTAAQIQLLKNNLNDVAIEVGEQLVPAVRDSVVVLGDALELWRGLPKPVQETAVRLGAATSGIALFSGGLLMVLPRMAEMTASFTKMWRASVLFRTSIIGGVGLIAGLTLLPPVLDAIKGKSAAPTLEQMAQASDRLSKSLAGLSDKDLILNRLAGELGKVAEQQREFAKFGEMAPLNAAVISMIEKLDELGVTYPEVMKIVENSGVTMGDAVQGALGDLETKYTNHLEELESFRLANWAAWAGAGDAAATHAPEIGDLMGELRTETEEAMKGSEAALQSLLPTMEEEFAAWEKRLDDTAQAYRDFEPNLRAVLDGLVAAHVESPERIILALEAAGPEVTAVMARQLAENPKAAVEGVLSDMGTVAELSTDEMMTGITGSVIAGSVAFRQALAEKIGVPIGAIPKTREFAMFVANDAGAFEQKAKLFKQLIEAIPTSKTVKLSVLGGKLKELTVSAPVNPQQHGGIYETTKPTLFMTSEHGQREGAVFLPGGLPSGASGGSARGAGGGGSTTMHVSIYLSTTERLDDPAVAERLWRNMEAISRRRAG